ncbi:MAG: Ppx/GppA family phosphatase [Coriobacteriia bacterium]|nr:Ppx/GppA family phosphatase [Coriobacteriia bacterium]
MRRIAAVDVGTVTTRLLVADVSSTESGVKIDEVERSTDITHLGEGLAVRGSLSLEAMGRVADVVGRYAERMRSLGVEEHSAIATSASRDAANSAELLSLLESRGLRPLVVSGEREAELSFGGATLGVEGEGLLVDDIGGGSTELILGDICVAGGEARARAVHSLSLDVGSRRITELFLPTDPPSAEELDAARRFAERTLRPFFETAPKKARVMISVAGTATTIASIVLGMPTPEYDAARVQDFMLDRETVEETLLMLAGLPLRERERVVGLHPGRAPVIVGGVLVLLTLLDLAELDSTRVSDRDILYGMLLDVYRRSW